LLLLRVTATLHVDDLGRQVRCPSLEVKKCGADLLLAAMLPDRDLFNDSLVPAPSDGGRIVPKTSPFTVIWGMRAARTARATRIVFPLRMRSLIRNILSLMRERSPDIWREMKGD
jgi:hypothetical protein